MANCGRRHGQGGFLINLSTFCLATPLKTRISFYMSQNNRRKFEMLFHARMNINYHSMAERRISLFIDLANLISIIMSSSLLVTFISKMPSWVVSNKDFLIVIISLFILAINTAVRSFNLTAKLYQHRDFKGQWHFMLSKISAIEIGKNGDDEQEDLLALENEQAAINAKEPPPNKRLLKKAYMETCVNLGLTPETGEET